MQIFHLEDIPEEVYHGSTTQHRKDLQNINVKCGRADLDFGQGFYTTSVKNQAIEWAKGRAFGPYKPLVLTYKVDVDKIKRIMNGKFFKNAADDWVRYIFEHRMNIYDIGKDKDNYDYIYGHMADGKITLLIEKCKQNILTYHDFREKVYPTECRIFYYDQLLFRTDLSITALKKINEEVF